MRSEVNQEQSEHRSGEGEVTANGNGLLGYPSNH